jgi:hypothetical protein
VIPIRDPHRSLSSSPEASCKPVKGVPYYAGPSLKVIEAGQPMVWSQATGLEPSKPAANCIPLGYTGKLPVLQLARARFGLVVDLS